MKEKHFNTQRFFLALADGTRLRLLNLMGNKEVCVCYLVEVLHQSQPKISRHLAYLRKTGMVSARREGKWMHYRREIPSDAGAARVLLEVLGWLRTEKSMQMDRARLNAICCSPSKCSALQGAPIPAKPSNKKVRQQNGK